jgi:hypothetical protein
MASAARYEYQPLESRHIRILELEPGGDAEPFQGRFDTASIDSGVKYDALSYVWGDATPVNTVTVSGQAIPIAANLATALKYLRNCNTMNFYRASTYRMLRKAQPLRIWVDAICINQDDIHEREQQVAMMRMVYSKAQHVRIWINEPDFVEDDPAVAALCKFRLGSDPDSRLGEEDAYFWSPVLSLFMNEYWSRLWIQQEVLNAQELVLHCKSDIVPGEAVAHFHHAFMDTWMANAMVPSTWSAVINYSDLIATPACTGIYNYNIKKFRSFSLIQLMVRCCTTRVTRGQDRLYAIMHLAKDYEEGAITVNYSKSPVQVMLDAASHHINRNRDLGVDFLHICSWQDDSGTYGRKSQPEPIPTWIPRAWIGYGDVKEQFHGYHWRIPLQTMCPPFSVDTEARRLRVRGVQIDAVRHNLTHNLRDPGTTIAQFWSSSLGVYLASRVDSVWEEFPKDVINVLIASPNTDLDDSDVASGLKHLFLLREDPMYANPVFAPNIWEIIDDLPISRVRRVQALKVQALKATLDGVRKSLTILTDADYFGTAPVCALEVGDEVWMILGCATPIIVRPQSNGAYWHICTAYIPIIVEHEDIVQYLTSDVQPGEKVGKWTVKDIELE